MTSPLYIPRSPEQILSDGIRQMVAFHAPAEMIGNMVMRLGNCAEARLLPEYLKHPESELEPAPGAIAGEN